MSDPIIAVKSVSTRPLAFEVIVSDARGESRHQVTMSAEDAACWGKLGAEPSRCVEAAMRFLLDREPKEAILSAFDIRVIRRYFPEFDDAFPTYLARLGGKSGQNA
jgi:hypothetical protein